MKAERGLVFDSGARYDIDKFATNQDKLDILGLTDIRLLKCGKIIYFTLYYLSNLTNSSTRASYKVGSG